MYEMNGKKEQKKGALLAKDCAYIAVFIALSAMLSGKKNNARSEDASGDKKE